MSNIVYFNKDGVETHRAIKSKGRPPKGAVKTEDGDFHIFPQDEVVKEGIFYIIQDEDGSIISKEPKGRGRSKPGYEKREDGNWYKTETMVLETPVKL